MNHRIPIAFAFDEHLILAAEVAISSLLMNAKDGTSYDIFVLHGEHTDLSAFGAERLMQAYPNHRITFRSVGDAFQGAFEIRGITNVTYYRLLIPDLIPEYDKVIYSDVDVIFRSDLSEIYHATKFDGEYFAGVNSLAHRVPAYRKYYELDMKMSAETIAYAGNIILNSKLIREAGLVDTFCRLAAHNFRFQDLDILNIACKDRILFLPPTFCVSTYFMEYAVHHKAWLAEAWSAEVIEAALENGIVHYNGAKPWNKYCVNFDIWWEYYRRSPFFDRKFYFDFFYSRLNEYDLLPLWKRIKILVRYFVYGRRSE